MGRAVVGRFAYDAGRVRVAERDGSWRVRWSESILHPDLGEGQRLGTEVVAAERAPILDREGGELVRNRPVVEVGVIPHKLEDRDAAVEAITGATEASAKSLRRSIARAKPANFVPAVTMRRGEFDSIRGPLDDIKGIEFGDRSLPLAPTRDFARALLGTVGPITQEQLDELGAPYEAGDLVGQGGLQEAHEERLAGTDTRRVVIRDSADIAIDTLLEIEGEEGRPLRTTLDAETQLAAERALGDVRGKAALVAVRPSNGDVLAAANRPTDEAFNRAFEGQYPPGSTFKVISTAALLKAGLDPGETVECPRFIDVGGMQFKNFEGSAAGAVPFRTDFAESCNTAFVSLAERLDRGALRDASAGFGIGSGHELGAPAYLGKVPPGRNDVEHAAAMIGQARILVSPLALAGVAAAVVEGRWRAPRTLGSDSREAGRPLPRQQVRILRELMRLVVTDGTGTALAATEGDPIGKSGTAEYRSGDPPPTHAWFIAARDDIAVAVLVENAPSGGESAAPIAAEFLDEVAR